MFKLEKLEQSDIFDFYPNRRDAFTSHKVLDMLYDFNLFKQMGPMYALKKDKECIAIMGIAILNRVSGHAYMAGSDKLMGGTKEVRQFIKSVKNSIKIIAKAYNLKRIQCDVDASNERNYRFARLLGFEYEGSCPHYYEDGTDAIIMGMILL